MGTGMEDEMTSPLNSSPRKGTSLGDGSVSVSSSEKVGATGEKNVENSTVNHSKKRQRSESDDSGTDHSTELVPGAVPPSPPDPLIVENFDQHLPSTVTLLETQEGAKVYLVGTAHFSLESQDDVSTVIRNVRPHIVMVELCRNRASILQMDEETIEREAKSITFEKIMATIKENGMFHGLMYTLFLNMSAQLTKELGMAPGGEFRRALSEVRMLHNCVIHFGDRPIQVTLKRALSVLSWWKSIRLVWHLAFSKSTTKEDVEKCKQKDLLEQMLKEMSGEFPELGRVFVEERDVFLTYSLQLATFHQPGRISRTPPEPVRVVGIVGIGHVPGITRLWGTVKDSDIPPIMTIPPPSRSGQIVKASLKVAALGLVVWGAYKLFAPKALSDAIYKVPRNLLSLVKGPIKTNIPGPGLEEEVLDSSLCVKCTCKTSCDQECACIRFSGGKNYINNLLSDEKESSSFILECNDSCECSLNCGNRLVQLGPRKNLSVFKTVTRGCGLKTESFIGRGSFVCEYAGEVIGKEEAKKRTRNDSMNYIFVLKEHSSNSVTETIVDPTCIGNIGRYINHSCQPNAGIVPVRVDSPIPRLGVFAITDINAGEEVTYDYSSGGSGIGTTRCYCGAEKCREFLPFDGDLLS